MVRMLALLALFTVTSASCSPTPQALVDVDGLAERWSDAVWQVESNGCGWKMRGSAFAIDERHLVTNRHVVANDSSPIVRSRDGKERMGKVIGASTHPDVAVIEVADDLPAYMLWAATSSLVKRERLVVIGYPSPAYAFKASTGQIVNFQGLGDAHEAALVNAKVARGNSGGPGLRGDASVAGVVTQMTVREKPEERVAILFTADAIRPTVTRFLREPSKVLSSCGLGPDYVPPVPKSYDIKDSPPTTEPVQALPVPPAGPSAPRQLTDTPQPTESAATKMPPQCPAGAPDVEVSELTATQKPDDPGWWRVDVRGLVRNDTSSSILIQAVEVRVDGDPPVTGPAGQYSARLPRGQETRWVFDEQYVYSAGSQPTRAEATVDWDWTNSNGDSFTAIGGVDCRSDDVTSSGPNPTPTPSNSYGRGA